MRPPPNLSSSHHTYCHHPRQSAPPVQTQRSAPAVNPTPRPPHQFQLQLDRRQTTAGLATTVRPVARGGTPQERSPRSRNGGRAVPRARRHSIVRGRVSCPVWRRCLARLRVGCSRMCRAWAGFDWCVFGWMVVVCFWM